jgi:hypothetical protein
MWPRAAPFCAWRGSERNEYLLLLRAVKRAQLLVRCRGPIHQDVAEVVRQSAYVFPGGSWECRFGESIGIELERISDCHCAPQSDPVPQSSVSQSDAGAWATYACSANGECLTYRNRIFRVKISYRCKKFAALSLAGEQAANGSPQRKLLIWFRILKKPN